MHGAGSCSAHSSSRASRLLLRAARRVARVDRESGLERNSKGTREDRMPQLTVFGTQTKVTTTGLSCACEMTVPQRSSDPAPNGGTQPAHEPLASPPALAFPNVDPALIGAQQEGRPAPGDPLYQVRSAADVTDVGELPHIELL